MDTWCDLVVSRAITVGGSGLPERLAPLWSVPRGPFMHKTQVFLVQQMALDLKIPQRCHLSRLVKAPVSYGHISEICLGSIGTCPNQLFAWTLAGWEQLRWVIKRLILTCRRRDESSSLLLQVYEPFYNSPQLFPTTKSSCKELIWASPYYKEFICDA